MHYIAYTVKGLEKVAEEEIVSTCPDAEIIQVEEKVVMFRTEGGQEDLLRLRTVDDIGLLVCEILEPKKLDITTLQEVVQHEDLPRCREKLTQVRNINETFSLTLSIAGVKLKQQEVLACVTESLSQKYGWHFTEKQRENFDIRLFINRHFGHMSVRLSSRSLFQRAHKLHSVMGALRPSVAGAMVRVATRGERDLKVVDNFCGSGTILEEALYAGNEVFGGDIEREAVRKTKDNLNSLQVNNQADIRYLDAMDTQWSDSSFDCAISNLPWDRQVPVKSITELYVKTLEEYRRILKPDGTLCLILSKPEILIKYAKRLFPHHTIEKHRISFLGQQPTVVVVRVR
ncbi:MAG: TRM11 family SAM-dependent methyltransferase [Candidatus Dojkabacteria bacterium]